MSTRDVGSAFIARPRRHLGPEEVYAPATGRAGLDVPHDRVVGRLAGGDRQQLVLVRTG
jgi:hypothetical protein